MPEATPEPDQMREFVCSRCGTTWDSRARLRLIARPAAGIRDDATRRSLLSGRAGRLRSNLGQTPLDAAESTS